MPLDSLDTLDSMATRTAPTPMQPTQIARPFHHEGWVYEEKVDGWRMLAYKLAGSVKLVSRNGRDHTSRFPGIVAALRKLDATGLILDGEVAVYDAQLVSRFEGSGTRRRLIYRLRRSSWCSIACKRVARISEASRSTSAAT